MEIGVERGLKLKTSRYSYISNYMLLSLVIVLFILLIPSLSFSFVPKTPEEFAKTMVVLLFLGLVGFLIEEPAIERLLRQYHITGNEIIKVEGFFRKKRISIPFQSIADIRVNKGVMGRIFDFGNVEVTGFKDGINIKGIRNPEEVYRVIQNKITVLRGPPRVRRHRIEET